MLLQHYCSSFPQMHNWCQTEFRWTGWRKLASPFHEQTTENGASGAASLPPDGKWETQWWNNKYNQSDDQKQPCLLEKHWGNAIIYQIFIQFNGYLIWLYELLYLKILELLYELFPFELYKYSLWVSKNQCI